MLACVYLMLGTCLVHGEKVVRRYYGIFKMRSNQTRESARRRREESHWQRPVKWLRGADPWSLRMEGVGHPMNERDALIQEAILTARGLDDGGGPVRGGPWSNPHMGNTSRDEAAKVKRLAANAESPAEARRNVLEYAESLDDDSYLRRHCLDLRFYTDSHEEEQGAPKRKRGKGKRYHSGNIKRKRWLLTGAAKQRHKYGADVEVNRQSMLAMRSREHS